MFCSHCGKELQPGTKFCPGCGADVSAESRVAHSANKAFREAEGELNNAVNEVRDTFQNSGAGYAGERLTFQENGTTVLMWHLVGAVLCGIGPLVAMNILIKNSNKICNAYNRYNNL